MIRSTKNMTNSKTEQKKTNDLENKTKGTTKIKYKNVQEKNMKIIAVIRGLCPFSMTVVVTTIVTAVTLVKNVHICQELHLTCRLCPDS